MKHNFVFDFHYIRESGGYGKQEEAVYHCTIHGEALTHEVWTDAYDVRTNGIKEVIKSQK